MRKTWLLLVPVLFAIAATIMLFGPYPEITAQLEGVTPLEESPATVEREARVRERLGEDISLYRPHLVLDIPFAAANAGVLALLIAFAASRVLAGGRMRCVLLSVPALLFVSELVENVALFVALFVQRGEGAWLTTAEVATGAKLALIPTSGLIALGLWVALGARWANGLIRRRRVAMRVATQ